MNPLRASYRLQLRQGVGFRQVAARVPQLAQLGVSHVYLSPILQARRGSEHGYDVVDPTVVDPSLGGEDGLAELVQTLRRHRMGLLLDIVPNHMAAEPRENPYFDDVLARGPASRFARWFDIDWGKVDAGRHARLLLPVLGQPLTRVLADGELGLARSGAELRVHYGEQSFPLNPATLPAILRSALEAPTGPAIDTAIALFQAPGPGGDRMARLLARQAYRLGYWRSAQRKLNYRRFFDVNGLIAVRCEDEEVFEATHAKTLELVARGWIDGLRIDHVDGLLDPRQYLKRLRSAVDARLPAGTRSAFVLLVEKILARGERLATSWPVDGTTGYEFMNGVEAALLEPRGVESIAAAWSRFTGRTTSFDELAREAKRRALEGALSPDLDRLAAEFDRLRAEGRARPATQSHRDSLRELIVELPVYRTYAAARGRIAASDRELLERALERARRRKQAGARSLALLAGCVHRACEASHPGERRLLQHLQQLSGPAAAKGVEDTALYVHVPLLSRNEVGSEPDAPLGRALSELHAAARLRVRQHARGLLATTTHDTKRSADVRARLDVLSEIPGPWERAVRRWQRWNRPLKRRVGGRLAPDSNTEWLLYQTLVGIWPLPTQGREPSLPSAAVLRELRERVTGYMEKAAREAEQHTSWIEPKPAFEEALRAFVGSLLAGPGRRSGFLADLTRLVREVARPGLWNSLSRTLIQLTAPGVPDLYQGDECWSFSLVDPDNRRPIDFAGGRRRLRRVATGFGSQRREAFLRGLVAHAESGSIKLHVIRAVLEARRRHPELFARGDYRALRASGSRARHVLAFARVTRNAAAVIVAPRLSRLLVGGSDAAPVGAFAWRDTRLCLPHGFEGRTLFSPLTGRRHRVRAGEARRPDIALGDLLDELPVALLVARL